MSTLIQCPACSQKFNLQGRLPALFTCTKCQQPMDLTGFPGYVPEEPAAAAPARVAAPSRGGGRSSSSSSRSRRRSREEEEEDDRRGRFEPKKNNTPLLVGAIVGVLALVVIVIVVMSKKDKGGTVAPLPTDAAAAPGTQPGGIGTPFDPTAPATSPGAPGMPSPGAATPGGMPGTPAAGTPAPGAPGTPAPDPAAGKPKGNLSLKTWPYPDDVSKEDQQRIDQALETALNQVGIDQRTAEKTLVAMGRKAIWRLVSEFKHIQDTDTFEGRKGLVKAMITDRILRKIDGHMERNTGYKMPINPESTLEYSTGVAKQWNGWLERGFYKKELPPWDDRVDGQDEPKDKPAPRGR